MSIRPIESAADYTAAMAVIDDLLARPAATPEEEALLHALTVLVDDYEARHHPIAALDPVTFLQAHMENSGHTQAELAALIGRSQASEVLNRRRPMSLETIRKICAAWKIPADLLIAPYPVSRNAA